MPAVPGPASKAGRIDAAPAQGVLGRLDNLDQVPLVVEGGKGVPLHADNKAVQRVTVVLANRGLPEGRSVPPWVERVEAGENTVESSP